MSLQAKLRSPLHEDVSYRLLPANLSGVSCAVTQTEHENCRENKAKSHVAP